MYVCGYLNHNHGRSGRTYVKHKRILPEHEEFKIIMAEYQSLGCGTVSFEWHILQ